MPDLFASLDEILASGNAPAGFDLLIDNFLAGQEYGLAFEARLMKKRFELGLPLIQNDTPDDPVYQAAVVEMARDTGQLFLKAGNIERAWPYFRAISDIAPIRQAIEDLQPSEGQEGVISIAFQEGVHPRKGIELILAAHGMCRALTAFGMTAVTTDRDQCLAVLTRGLYGEAAERLRSAIEAHEGSMPSSTRVVELIQGREWLFGEWDYYVDTSHLLTIIPYCTEITDPEILRLMHELCEYGKCLAPKFHSQGIPPFENQFEAYDHYALALMGQDADAHIEYFRRQVSESDPDVVGDAPGRTLVRLLVSLHRGAEALDVLLEHVFEDAPYGVPVPPALQLCYQTGDFARMTEIAKERGDMLSYAAAKILTGR